MTLDFTLSNSSNACLSSASSKSDSSVMHAAADPDMVDVTLIASLGEADCAVRICQFYDFCPAVVVQYCECDQDIGSEVRRETRNNSAL